MAKPRDGRSPHGDRHPHQRAHRGVHLRVRQLLHLGRDPADRWRTGREPDAGTRALKGNVLDENEKNENEQNQPDPAPDEALTPDESADEIDAAKLSDEAAQAAARAFLGTAEPEEEVSVDEAKNLLRRAGAVAEAEPEAAVAPAPE